MTNLSLKAALDSGRFILAPGVFDMLSLLIADNRNFPALFFSGYWGMASDLGLPDAGIATYRDFMSRISKICEATKTPLIADADTGFGGLLNLHHTVQGYETAGVAAIQIEDQVNPKKCGHQAGIAIVPAEEMVKRIEVAVAARSSDEMLLVARTDAIGTEGLAAAISRGQQYHDAGADVILVEAPQSEQQMRKICSEIPGPQMINMAHGGKTPIMSASVLEDIGYSVAIVPSAPALAALQSMDNVFDLLEQGIINIEEHQPLYDFERFSDQIGFPDVHAFEEKWKL